MGEITRRDFIKGAAALAPLAFPSFPGPQQGAASERFDIVIAGAGQERAWRGRVLEEGTYDLLPGSSPSRRSRE